MPKVSKGPPPDELVQLRAVLASNLRAYITVKYGSDTPETTAAAEIGSATGLGKNTVLRALGKGGDDIDIRLDTLVRLALHFGAGPRDLLHDYGSSKAQKKVAKTRTTNTARDQGVASEVGRASLHGRRGRAA